MPASYRYANTPLGLTVQNRRYHTPYTRPAQIRVSSHAEYNALSASERARAKLPDTLHPQPSPPPAPPVQAPSVKRAASPTPLPSEPQPKRWRVASPDPRDQRIQELELELREKNKELVEMQCRLSVSESAAHLLSCENKAFQKQLVVMSNELQYSHRAIADVKARCALEVDEANDAAFKRSAEREDWLRGDRCQLEKEIEAFEEVKRQNRNELESAKELATQRGHRNEAIRAENEDLKADLAEKDQEIAALKACIQAEPQPLPTYTSPFPEMHSQQPSHSQSTPTYTSPYVQTQPQQAFYSEPTPTYFSPYSQEQSPNSQPFYSFGHLSQKPAPAFNYEAREAYSEPPQAVGIELPQHTDSEAPQKEESEPPQQRVYSKLPRRAVYAEPSKPVYSEPPPPEPEAAKPKSSERDAEIFDGGRAIEEEAARAKAARAAEKAAADAMVAAKQEALKAQLAAEALSGFADTAAPPPEFSAPSSSAAVVRKRMSARERAARKAIGRPRRK